MDDGGAAARGCGRRAVVDAVDRGELGFALSYWPRQRRAVGRCSPPCGRGRRARLRRVRRRGSRRGCRPGTPTARDRPRRGRRPRPRLRCAGRALGRTPSRRRARRSPPRRCRGRPPRAPDCRPSSAETMRCSRAMSWAEPSTCRAAAGAAPTAAGGVGHPVGQVHVAAGDPLVVERRPQRGNVLGEPGVQPARRRSRRLSTAEPSPRP